MSSRCAPSPQQATKMGQFKRSKKVCYDISNFLIRVRQRTGPSVMT